jgi:hypothetical protein
MIETSSVNPLLISSKIRFSENLINTEVKHKEQAKY